MNIIVSELFLSACLTPLHRTLSGDTPERKHFPQPRPQQPPTNPDICSFTRPSLPPSGFHARFFPPLIHVCQNWPVYRGTGRQTPPSPPPIPWNTWIRTRGRLPEILLYWLKWRGGGGMTKTTACVGEHCLRLRLEIFSGKTGFYTQWSWVWRKGAHIKRSAFMCAELLVFKLHLHGEGPICYFFLPTRL